MEYNLWPLVGAVLLLCTPSYLFFTSRVRRRIVELALSGGFSLLGIARPWHNWLDLARGFGGAFLLYHHVFELDPQAEEYMKELGVVAGVIAFALLLNTYYKKRKHLYCIAPIFLVTGIAMVTFDWWIVLYGVVAGAVLGRLSDSPEIALIVMGLVVGAFGYFFAGLSLMLLLTCALIVLPVVYAFTTNRNLAAPSCISSTDE